MLVKNSFSINNYRAIDSQCQLGPAQFVPAEDKSECKCVYVLVVCECVCIYVGPSVWGGGEALVCLPNYVHTFFHSTIPCRQAAESGRDSGAVLPTAQRYCVDNHLQSADKNKQEGFQRRCVMNPTSVVCTTYSYVCMYDIVQL